MLHGNARKSRGWGGAFELDPEDEYRHWQASGGGGLGQYWKVLDAQRTRRCHFYLPEAPAFIYPLQSGICLQWGTPSFNLWVRKIPWRREWQTTPVFLPGESHRQRSFVHGVTKSLNMTERLTCSLSLCNHKAHLQIYPTACFCHLTPLFVTGKRRQLGCLLQSHFQRLLKVKVKVAQSCLTLCNSPWNSPGQNTGVGSPSLPQGIFPTQGSNPGLPHCRQILYQLSHKESPRILEWVDYPFSRGSSQPRNWIRVSCIAGRLFTHWAMREAHSETSIWKQITNIASIQFSHSVMSDSFWPHGVQRAGLPCPSPTPRACSNSCPSSWWCHPTEQYGMVLFGLFTPFLEDIGIQCQYVHFLKVSGNSLMVQWLGLSTFTAGARVQSLACKPQSVAKN